jgi:hypothetical protein
MPPHARVTLMHEVRTVLAASVLIGEEERQSDACQ